MPTYKFECEPCQFRLEVYMPLSMLDQFGPPECEEHGPMQYVWELNKTRPFPAFTTTHVDGKPLEITSLHQIRKLEKERERSKFCWEMGSYDSSHYGDS